MSITKPFDFLRIVAAIFMAIHGIARISLGNVAGLGTFLDASGFPLPLLLAWLVTILEIVGAILLIANYKVSYASAYYIFQLLMGIFLVHLKEGWFVVGPGRNGIEYNVLLICCFVAFIWDDMLNKNSS